MSRVRFSVCPFCALSELSSAECDTWRRGQNPPAERVLVGMRFEENSRKIEIGEKAPSDQR